MRAITVSSCGYALTTLAVKRLLEGARGGWDQSFGSGTCGHGDSCRQLDIPESLPVMSALMHLRDWMTLHFPHCRLLLKKSGSATPRVELEEMGPSLDLSLRRARLADSTTYKIACKVPKQAKVWQSILFFFLVAGFSRLCDPTRPKVSRM